MVHEIDRAVIDIGFTTFIIGRIGYNRGTMDDYVYIFGPFDLFHLIEIAEDQIDIEPLDEMEVGSFPDQAIDGVTFVQKKAAKVRSDETVSSCDQDILHYILILDALCTQ